MTDAAGPAEGTPDAPKKGGKILIVATLAALALGGGAFYAVHSGMVTLPFGAAAEAPEADETEPVEAAALSPERAAARPAAFVALAPMVISLAPETGAKHLKVSVQLEVAPERAAEVEAVLPRVADVLNTFLRAVAPGDLARPRSMARLRAQMLRRVRLVTPEGSVRDVLIQEFVLN